MKMTERNLYSMLHKDHQKIMHLLDRLWKFRTHGKAVTLLRQTNAFFSAHLQAEKQIFGTAFLDNEALDALKQNEVAISQLFSAVEQSSGLQGLSEIGLK